MKVEFIRFKAKSIEEENMLSPQGSWVIGEFFHFGGHYHISHPVMPNECKPLVYTSTKVDPETLCMFTSFKDKNGKEIWEGDILEHTQSHARFTVMFDRGAFFIRRNGTENTDLYLFELSEKESCLQLFEVVGNKFDTGNSLESIYKSKKQ